MGKSFYLWLCALAIAFAALGPVNSARVLEFPQHHLTLSKDVRTYLNGISPAQWMEFVTSGIDSVNRQKRLEDNLLSSDITVQNGSLSHPQLLDTLPNAKSKFDSDIALKIMKASLFAYNSKCVPQGMSDDDCRAFLETKPLPEGSTLKAECDTLLQSPRSSHHPFRRLLAQHYKNGFHEMFGEDELPTAWSISKALYDHENDGPQKTRPRTRSDADDSQNANLVLVQFAQFIEHDLSKTVVQSMSKGSPIECCGRDQNSLQPRYHHPQCAPILFKDKYGFRNCLNYVRSALAVGKTCSFGAAEQLNQATGILDLSQLYGFTEVAERKMRTFVKGALKSTTTGNLLPMASRDEGHTFCAWGSNTSANTCFFAGDSRVNSSPYSILVYTIFMRNHNRIAGELLTRHVNWSDEQLFQAAKAINIDIYRRVIMEEWLPEVLGEENFAAVLVTPPATSGQTLSEVSNEFGVAAIRFYLSMLPNVLYNTETDTENGLKTNNNVQPQRNLLELKNEVYRPQLYTSKKLNDILQSLLHERAMKMDASYVGAIVWHQQGKPMHADVLAFDIQRGRDHGVQPYYKYLEACNNKKITHWRDFETIIPKELVDRLKNVYRSWTDVDLIIGGISERTFNGTVGPTFSCIIAEQFSKIHQRHQQSQSPAHADLLKVYSSIKGVELLCLNSNVEAVPANIFRLQSNSNRLINCSDVA